MSVETVTQQPVSVVDVMTAVAWRPQAGDTITGALVHRQVRTTEFGTYPIVYLDAGQDHLVAIHAFHTTLREGFKEAAPTRGEFISVTYAGMKDSNQRKDKNGDPVEYHHYAVYRPDETVDAAELDWDNVPF